MSVGWCRCPYIPIGVFGFESRDHVFPVRRERKRVVSGGVGGAIELTYRILPWIGGALLLLVVDVYLHCKHTFGIRRRMLGIMVDLDIIFVFS